MSELLDVGKHCARPLCNQLDFLPYKCDRCQKIFCGEHRTYEAHECKGEDRKNRVAPVCPLCQAVLPLKPGQNPDFVVSRHIDRGCQMPSKSQISYECNLEKCHERDLVRLCCKSCGKHFCVKHRHEGEHNCEAHAKKMKERAAKAEKAAKAADKAQKQKKKAIAKQKFANTKHSAVGEPNLDLARRFHIAVYFPTEAAKQPHYMYFNSQWPVGRVVDKLATFANIKNANNVAGEERLNLFSSRTGKVLQHNQTLESLKAAGVLKPGDAALLARGDVLDFDVPESEKNCVVQ